MKIMNIGDSVLEFHTAYTEFVLMRVKYIKISAYI